jgi:hypothetical protein
MMPVLSDPNRFRQAVAGVSLIGAPLAGFLSCLSDADEGTGEKGADLYPTLQAHAGGIHTTGLVFMVSAVLTVPLALGIAHVLRGRGATLGNLGAAALGLGAFGHFGYGLWQVVVSRAVAPGAPADVVAYLDRISSATGFLVPLMILVDVGLVLLCAGLLRARAVPAWAPWLAIGVIAADFGVQFTGVSATWPVAVVWAVLTVALGYVGVRFLAMPASTWARYGSVATDAAPPSTSDRPAVGQPQRI